MPCIDCIRNMSGDFLRSERFLELFQSGDSLLLLDCRSQAEFVKSHVKGAINITLPSLMLRRLKKGNLKLPCVIQNNEAKEKFNKMWKTHEIVLYDENSTDSNSNPASTLDLLFKKLRQDGARVSALYGGFSAFENQHRECCVGQENTEDTISGLCNLRISDDSGNGTSDSDCDNVNSPSSLSPFPVEVLPYLYLGNAKNSADINQLKKYGIKYILNVTPNVPNKFAEDDDFKYLQIPVADQLSQNLSAFFPQAIAFIDEARKSENGVLVHCLAGISRSVTVTVAYLMQTLQLSLNQAYDHVKGCKPNISPNFNFMGQLLDFEKHLGFAPSVGKPDEFHCPSPVTPQECPIVQT